MLPDTLSLCPCVFKEVTHVTSVTYLPKRHFTLRSWQRQRSEGHEDPALPGLNCLPLFLFQMSLWTQKTLPKRLLHVFKANLTISLNSSKLRSGRNLNNTFFLFKVPKDILQQPSVRAKLCRHCLELSRYSLTFQQAIHSGVLN